MSIYPLTPALVQKLGGLAGLFDLQAIERDLPETIKRFAHDVVATVPGSATYGLPDLTPAHLNAAAREYKDAQRLLADVTKAYLGLPSNLSHADIRLLQQLAAQNSFQNMALASSITEETNTGRPMDQAAIFHLCQLEDIFDHFIERRAAALLPGTQHRYDQQTQTPFRVDGTAQQLGQAFSFYRTAQVRQAFPLALLGVRTIEQAMAATRSQPPAFIFNPVGPVVRN